ncbi:hypothetical protein OIU76_024645 [Salix suchowensis]|nr:hypothetical protein OIU76_024645 [Salix suchowensis]
MDDDEFISYVLDGLGLEYKELATTLHLHPNIDFNQFYDLALREEHLRPQALLWLLTVCPTNTASTQNYPVIITTNLEDVMAEIGIKGMEQEKQCTGSKIKGLGLQTVAHSIVIHNLPSSLPLQPSLMVVLLCFQHHKAKPHKPNEVK